MTCGIYQIVSPSGKRYVGSSHNMERRWNVHRSLMARGLHGNSFLQNAWSKYKGLGFSFLLVCRREDLLMYEQAAIDGLSPEMNHLRVAGSSQGWRHSEQTRERLRASHTGRRCGPVTEETRRKLSESNKGKHQNPETAAKISKALKGKKQSPELIEKRISKIRGSKRTAEQRERMSASKLGIKMTAVFIPDGNGGFRKTLRKL